MPVTSLAQCSLFPSLRSMLHTSAELIKLVNSVITLCNPIIEITKRAQACLTGRAYDSSGTV